MYNTTEAKIFCLIAIKLKTKDLLINFVYIVTYRNQLKVAPLKNLLFLAVLKLDVKNSFGYNKKNWKDGKNIYKYI